MWIKNCFDLSKIIKIVYDNLPYVLKILSNYHKPVATIIVYKNLNINGNLISHINLHTIFQFMWIKLLRQQKCTKIYKRFSINYT